MEVINARERRKEVKVTTEEETKSRDSNKENRGKKEKGRKPK